MVVSIVRVSQKTFAVPPVVHAVQGETGRVLWMELTDTALTDYDSPYTAGLYFKRSDGTYYSEECMTDPANNRCEADLDQALTQPGVTKCQLKIEDAAGICSTFDFNIIVHESMNGVSEEQLGYSIEEIREIIEGAEAGNQEIEDIRHGYDGTEYPSAGDAVRGQIVQAMENGGGLSDEVKDALLQIAQKVAYIDKKGQTYYDDLHNALYPPVTGVTLSATAWGSNTIGETYQLRATVTPSGWSGTVVWSSSNTSIATVSQTGLVTVVGYGLCIISATADSVSAPCRVFVTPLSVKSISAVFNQGANKIYDTDDFKTEIKKYLTVTATMSDDSTQVLPSTVYGVNTTYLEGASTGSAQATYNRKTSEWFSFNVTEWLTSLTVVYTQSGTVYNTDSLDSLKSDLVVTASYEDGTSGTVSEYSLSGTLEAGTSTITVAYGGKTATFTVTVTKVIDYTENPLANVEWHEGYSYNSSGEYVTAANQYVTDKFPVQGCLYRANSSNSATKSVKVHIWDENDTYVGFARHNSVKQVVYLKDGYTCALEYTNTASSFNSADITMMPVDNSSTAVAPFAINLSDYIESITRTNAPFGAYGYNFDPSVLDLGVYGVTYGNRETTIQNMNYLGNLISAAGPSFVASQFNIGFEYNGTVKKIYLTVSVKGITTVEAMQQYITDNNIVVKFNQ